MKKLNGTHSFFFFSSECRTHFHRLYHNTRDCSKPACIWLPELNCLSSSPATIVDQ
uniref:Uncharacterized protein n=1 Tax=Oncorhynchus mykiss TaxID=8022 RepID=A0A8K9XFX6_ONCMY